MTTINSTTPTTAATPTKTSLSPTSALGSNTLGKDAFMQLLITKMKNQDPTQPQDDSALLAQLAQFSTLEQMQQMNDTLTNISDVFTKATTTTDSGSTSSSSTPSTAKS